ncbi:MAG: hypothetical protein A3I26_03350 [Candidatus Yanofskybacteria bacterium RIFCSPLOWO2_02_FULL_43_10]|uniref:Uncharacterized protein n=1 Tax=Candidatus Yanofskybacteria bacterium RIFCSPLOWO2_12_FULL_43_11b TaxID=1802710 RepID=A0A1F8H868_9BACT|nr:MAG: hypothetical protein A3I26_03350 [Candidatus Yanofskybacteria bacterium RIFCSPLOWO2_02_FULL_43_10]OGN33812.1 MAG: hypothetical protein A3G51_04115 [Candidatus Yanofskybacteria bacterium RIFCSPLOWO2_12_FULL_43_11b]
MLRLFLFAVYIGFGTFFMIPILFFYALKGTTLKKFFLRIGLILVYIVVFIFLYPYAFVLITGYSLP